MADIRKEQERDELHRAIWAIADELRGSVDGWDFKSYVLGTMFYRYISENLTEYINAGEIAAGNDTFDYAQLSDEEAEEAREGLVQEKGFFMLPSELFCNVRARASQDENLNETLEKVFRHIEDSAKGSSSEQCFSGLFDDFDVNSNKLGATVAKRNEKLVKLLNGIGDMNLGAVQDHSIDAFGDAYEFLMTMYASNAGKSGGEFFTPSDVSELLTRLGTVGKTKVNKVYDPACGSGSLLLKATKVLGKDGVQFGYFGQEINITTYNLCRINMFLHDVGFDKFDIACEDTLTAPQHWDDEPFELIVSNPPYSIKWAGDTNPVLINDPRFAPAGVLAPKSNADFAFIMHALSWLATNGTAAIVCFPGIMYRGGAEQKIRQYLIDNNYIDAVIQLPSNLFFGTSIATCIMVLKKSKSENKTLFIDASKEFIKVGKDNKLTIENIENILTVYADRADKKYFSRLVNNAEIAENDYNLTVSTYIEQEDTREKIEIKTLHSDIKEVVAQGVSLRDEIDKIIQQYEYYRDKLLTFDDGVEYKTLGETIVSLNTGLNPRRFFKLNTDNANNYYVTIRELQNNKIVFSEKTDRMNDAALKLCNNRSNLEAGDVLFSGTGTIGVTALIEKTPENWNIKEGVYAIKPKRDIINSKFLMYLLCSEDIRKAFLKKAAGGTVKSVPMAELKSVPIPVPPLEEQGRIVNILDKFTALIENIDKEIELRQKQYEYYRDKLLTFKELTT